MKSDSNVAMTGSAGNYSGNKVERKVSQTEKELMKCMDDLASQQKESSTRMYNQRQEFIDLHKVKNEDNKKQATDADTQEAWKEYTLLGKEYKTIVKENDPDDHCILRNLTKRIRAVEDVLNINKEDSITNGYDG